MSRATNGPPFWPRNHLEATEMRPVGACQDLFQVICVWDECDGSWGPTDITTARGQLSEHRDHVVENADHEHDLEVARKRDEGRESRREDLLEALKATGHLVVERVR